MYQCFYPLAKCLLEEKWYINNWKAYFSTLNRIMTSYFAKHTRRTVWKLSLSWETYGIGNKIQFIRMSVVFKKYLLEYFLRWIFLSVFHMNISVYDKFFYKYMKNCNSDAIFYRFLNCNKLCVIFFQTYSKENMHRIENFCGYPFLFKKLQRQYLLLLPFLEALLTLEMRNNFNESIFFILKFAKITSTVPFLF